MGWARKTLGVELNPINVVESIGRKIDNEIIEPIKDVGRKIDDEILQPVKNTVEAIVEDPKKLAAVALAVAFPGAGAALGAQLGLTGVAAQVVGQTLINTTLNGGDVKSAVIGAALPLVGNVGAEAIGQALTNSNITGTLNTVITKAVTQGTTAALLGKDPLTAFVLGGASAGVSLITQDIPGFSELPDVAKNAVNTAVVAQISKGDVGSAVTTSIINDAISYATKAIDDYKKNPGGITNRVVDEAIPQGSGGAGTNDPFDVSQIGIGVGVKPDYSLTSGITFPSTDGLKVDPVTGAGATVGVSPVDYSLNIKAPFEGLQMPTSPNITGMGGGQGITVKTPEGELSESGVTKTGTAPDLGDPDSFINKPAPDVPDEAPIDPRDTLKLARRLIGLAGTGAIVNEITSGTSRRPVNFEYGDIYRDAPIKGFAMRKGEDGKYTPFIGEKAQLAKGGLATRRK
jgi:hypothetical protein